MFHISRILVALIVTLLALRIECTETETTNQSADTANFDTEEFPQETQSAQCTISAGEVQASAQATISKKLEGVCGSKQLAKSFEILESRLMYELYQIRLMLSQMSASAVHQQPFGTPSYHHQPYHPIPPANYMDMVPRRQETTTTTPTETAVPKIMPTVEIVTPTMSIPLHNTTVDSNNYFEAPSTESTQKAVQSANNDAGTTEPSLNTSATTSRSLSFKPVQTKSLKTQPKHVLRNKSRPRELEVARFNNTIMSGEDIRIFSYYWRIDHFQRKLQSNVSVIYSPVFSISGLHLKIKAILNHLNRDYLYLQLESLPAEALVDDSNVILESGTMFREIETRKLFRHKITILDQETPTSDLVSQEFLNTNSGFPVPNSAIISGPYAKDNNILIKVLIFV